MKLSGNDGFPFYIILKPGKNRVAACFIYHKPVYPASNKESIPEHLFT